MTKEKEKNSEVIGEEGDEIGDEKTNDKWLWIGKTKQENGNELM